MASSTRISELKYTVFMSYSRDDDDFYNRFITHFNDELNRMLNARLKKFGSPPSTYFDKENGPVHGPLDDALRRAINSSFAMIIFVHDGYVASQWCLQELKHFKALAGRRGIEKRLFIVAMSKDAIADLEQTVAWKDVAQEAELTWNPFFQEHDINTPMDIFLKHSRGVEAVVASDFWKKLLQISKALIAEFTEESAHDLVNFHPYESKVHPQSTLSSNSLDSLIYIEGEPGQEKYWEPLGKQVAAMWDTVATREQLEPRLLLRPTGLPMHNLHDRPRLDNADGVILIWADKTPESLLAQIAMVEPKLQGPRMAPGLIAYLIEVGKAQPETVPETLMNWPVVRFATRKEDGGSATVLIEDMLKLAKYLREVMDFKRSAR